jgi:hypothetical protein
VGAGRRAAGPHGQLAMSDRRPQLPDALLQPSMPVVGTPSRPRVQAKRLRLLPPGDSPPPPGAVRTRRPIFWAEATVDRPPPHPVSKSKPLSQTAPGEPRLSGKSRRRRSCCRQGEVDEVNAALPSCGGMGLQQGNRLKEIRRRRGWRDSRHPTPWSSA